MICFFSIFFHMTFKFFLKQVIALNAGNTARPSKKWTILEGINHR